MESSSSSNNEKVTGLNKANIHLSRSMNNAEKALTTAAAFPGLGILAGITKMAMGGAQAITALVCGVLAGIPSAAIGNTQLLHHSWTHLKHGLGNIAAGLFEAVPIVGTMLYYKRMSFKEGADQERLNQNKPVTGGHEDKFMAYPGLEIIDNKNFANNYSDVTRELKQNCNFDVNLLSDKEKDLLKIRIVQDKHNLDNFLDNGSFTEEFKHQVEIFERENLNASVKDKLNIAKKILSE